MRTAAVFIFLFLLPVISFSQNWSTFGGNSNRDGLSKITGPQNVATYLWTVPNAGPTTLGNAVYTFGDRFVTSRVIFSPYTGVVECRNLQNGALLWTSPFISTTSILYVIGHTEDGVYAHDYSTDTIYALHPNDGTLKWRSKIQSQTFGAYPGCVFACNGDLIVNGPIGSGKFTMRLDKSTGDTVWTNSELIAIGPAVGLAANESTVYRITGGITIPILLTAIDINSGITKYSSAPIPGDPDQENPITLGAGNRIYFWRDGGYLFAYDDVGSALVQAWTYVPLSTTGAALFGNIGIGPDQHLYVFDTGKIRRINHTNGVVIDSSVVNVSQGAISVGADSTVYVNDKNGKFYAFSSDLQTIKWQLNIGGNTYCNMALAKDGIMVFTGSGNQISACQTIQNIAPVADFGADSLIVASGQPVDFFDQSSFGPTSWQWYFPGAATGTSTLQHPTGIIYNTPGEYEVSLSVSNGYGTDSTIKHCYLKVVNGTGISLLQVTSGSFHIYPNPATNMIHLTMEEKFAGSVYVIRDITGRIVADGIWNDKDQKIEIDQLRPGTYFLSVEGLASSKLKLLKL